jgi:two-component sensor histidine kinase
MEPFGGRTSVNGADVLLTPKQAEYFSLALHELATNAAKYGALSNANGRVLISWTATEQGNNNKLDFKWQESEGPAVAAPIRQGFGTALIKSTFPDAQIDYAVEGLSCKIRLLVNEDPESENTPGPPYISTGDLGPDALRDTSEGLKQTLVGHETPS